MRTEVVVTAVERDDGLAGLALWWRYDGLDERRVALCNPPKLTLSGMYRINVRETGRTADRRQVI